MAVYTYEVDHGDDAPRVHAGMELNGGRVVAVQFKAALSRIEDLEKEVRKLKLDAESRENYEIEQRERL